MTVPRLTGFWDEAGAAIESLAQTITRSVDPHFDNKLALSKMLREDPTKAQAIADMDLLNPGLLEQLYGSDTTKRLRETASPSMNARVEQNTRNIANTDVRDIRATVLNQASLSKLGVEDALKRRGQEVNIDAQEQQTEYYEWRFDQERWKAALENPILKARFDGIQASMAQLPNGFLLDPYEEAKSFLQGTMDPNKLSAMQAQAPEIYEMFKMAVQDLGQNARADQAERIADRRIAAQNEREDRTDLNAARRQARTVTERSGLPFKDLVDYFMGKDTVNPAVQKFFEENQDVQDRLRISKSIRELQPLVNEYVKAEGANRGIAKSALEAGLYTVFQAPITLAKAPDGDTWAPWDKKVVYKLPTGREVDGNMLYELANNPDMFNRLEQNTQIAKSLTPDLASKEAASLQQNKERFISQFGQYLYEQFLSDLQKQAGGSATPARSRR